MKGYGCVLALAVVSASVVDPQLWRTMQHTEAMNIIVRVKESPSISAGPKQVFSSRTKQIESLAASLQLDAEEGQQSIMQVLQQESMGGTFGAVERFWISNSVFIENASPALIEELSLLPEVSGIHEEQIVPINPIESTMEHDVVSNFTFDSVPPSVEWGLSNMETPQSWQMYNKGKGIIVGNIDTGVRGTHEALRHNYVGAKRHGWFDPHGRTKVPNDSRGHGTHTMGSIVGGNGIGVAPEAEWLACTSASKQGQSERGLLACGQFMLCPTDTNGKNADCSLAPHVISNSWSGGQARQYYDDIINAWRKAGIIPIFSCGNNGGKCSTVGSPSDNPNVISVGAIEKGNKLAHFSSLGPALGSTLIKPDIAAPGMNIRSAWHKSDTAYHTISGTSQATPYVAGVVVLMKSQKKSLTYQAIYKALTQTARTQGLKGVQKNCGRIKETTFPNNAFGYGCVDAKGALDFIAGKKK